MPTHPTTHADHALQAQHLDHIKRRRRPNHPPDHHMPTGHGYQLRSTTPSAHPRKPRLDRLDLVPREVAVDGGFVLGPTEQALTALAPRRTFLSGRAEPGSRRTRERLARYRTSAEGRISHLKRG
jgi:hypothetical protein